MMIVVAHLNVSGVFRGLGALAIEHAHAPLVLLVTVTALAGILSAFLVNDAICLVMAPIVMQVDASYAGAIPLPYLVATATASNCGSVATITGNPQNMVIGAMSGIAYPAFTLALAPVAAFGLSRSVVAVCARVPEGICFRRRLRPHLTRRSRRSGRRGEPRLRGLAVAFFRRGPAGRGGAARRGDPALHPRDQARSGSTARSTGRFDPVRRPLHRGRRGRESAAHPRARRDAKGLGLDVPWRLSLFTAVLSNIVSNVPAVLILRPFNRHFP